MPGLELVYGLRVGVRLAVEADKDRRRVKGFGDDARAERSPESRRPT